MKIYDKRREKVGIMTEDVAVADVIKKEDIPNVSEINLIYWNCGEIGHRYQNF